MLLPAVIGALAGGFVTWVMAPRIARTQAEATLAAERPRLRAVFAGWGIIGPTILAFNVGARKTTVTEIGYYAADGSVGEPLWAVFEAGVNTAGPQAVNAFNPPKTGYLPKTVDAGDYIEVPISSSELRRVAVGSPTNEGRGLSGFWVKEATGTMTRVPIAPHVLSGLIEWLGPSV